MAIQDGPPQVERLHELHQNLCRVIRGKEEAIHILLTALVAGGSVLMEDVPGVGKTTLAKALARSLDAEFRRVQFTPDLLPTDILGASVYNPKEGTFTFHKGPIFCSVLLADEINRASPRTQSALLEAMSEGQATIEGVQYELPKPFLVLATQNPVDFHGTYPLPEAQLDRFLVRLELGYPNPDMEMAMLFDQAVSLPVDSVPVTMSTAELSQMQQDVRLVQVDESVAKYMLDIVARTRGHSMLKLGVSPRGSLMLFRAAQASAFVQGRRFVLPDDVQRVAPYVLSHRLVLTSKARYGAVAKHDVVYEILGSVPVPA
ncbi:MAG: MoxR family ATPase [Planctomycetaceae bacterium]|nr:MoxR family ATPase [Planctomycetaceae bacterium]